MHTKDNPAAAQGVCMLNLEFVNTPVGEVETGWVFLNWDTLPKWDPAEFHTKCTTTAEDISAYRNDEMFDMTPRAMGSDQHPRAPLSQLNLSLNDKVPQLDRGFATPRAEPRQRPRPFARCAGYPADRAGRPAASAASAAGPRGASELTLGDARATCNEMCAQLQGQDLTGLQ